MKKAQLLISIRGKDGGYQIAKDPEEITAKDIILAVEEKLDPVVCLSHTCTRFYGICRTQPVWMGMQEQIYKVLESKTLKYLTDIYRIRGECMKLSTKSRYAARCLIDLAIYGKDHPLSITEIGAREEIPNAIWS